jgi:hypothetical protein
MSPLKSQISNPSLKNLRNLRNPSLLKKLLCATLCRLCVTLCYPSSPFRVHLCSFVARLPLS